MIYTYHKSWQFIERFLEKTKDNPQIQEEFQIWYHDEKVKKALPVALKTDKDLKKNSEIQIDDFLRKLKSSLKNDIVSNTQFQKNVKTLGELLRLKNYEQDIYC